jgi:hypothetical protein
MGDLHTATGVTSKLPVSLLEFLKSANPMQKEEFKALSQHIKAGLTPRSPHAAAAARVQNAEAFLAQHCQRKTRLFNTFTRKPPCSTICNATCPCICSTDQMFACRSIMQLKTGWQKSSLQMTTRQLQQ